MRTHTISNEMREAANLYRKKTVIQSLKLFNYFVQELIIYIHILFVFKRARERHPGSLHVLLLE